VGTFEPHRWRVQDDVYLLRVRLPQRRGSLAAVATRLGQVGANISRLQVRLRDEDGAVVDFLVELPVEGRMADVVRGLDALDEVRVQWADHYPSGGGLSHDLDVIERMRTAARAPEQVLVTAAPLLCQAAWAVLLDASGHVRFRTPLAPALSMDDLAQLHPLDVPRGLDLGGGPRSTVAVVPVPPGAALVVGRSDGPPFTQSELARLEYLASARGRPPSDVVDSSHPGEAG